VELGRAHRLLELGRFDQPVDELVRLEQHVVIEQHVVDPDDPLTAQLLVVLERVRSEQLHVQAVMDVVVEVRARRDDVVHEPALDQRHQARHADPRRGHRPP
jgi:hypothetical protein